MIGMNQNSYIQLCISVGEIKCKRGGKNYAYMVPPFQRGAGWGWGVRDPFSRQFSKEIRQSRQELLSICPYCELH